MATQMAAPYSTAQPWYHGTDSGKFSAWQLPAPPKDQLLQQVQLFTSLKMKLRPWCGEKPMRCDVGFGCETLVPAQGGVDSHSLRAKLSADPEYGWCVHLALIRRGGTLGQLEK